MTDSDDALIEEAKDNFKLVCSTESKQRERECDDLKFQVPEEQWDKAARSGRGATRVTGPQGAMDIAARPTLSIPKLNQPIQIINGQMRSSMLSTKVHPMNERANKATSQIIQGMYRAIERDSCAAEVARPWAFDRAVKAGRGVYRINKVYDEYSSNRFDMKLTIDRVLHQENVYFDPAAQNPDWSDGEFAFHVAWLTRKQFMRKYPKAELSSQDSQQWLGAFAAAPDWIKRDGDHDSYLVAEYFYKRYEIENLYLMDTGEVVVAPDGQDLPNELKSRVLRERQARKCSVRWCTLNGLEIVEKGKWDGHLIPLVPTIGIELQPYDSERRWHGVIYNARDAQRLYNFAASGAVEIASLEPRAPWIMDPRQAEGYEDWWKKANVVNFPYLPYNAKVEGNSQIPAPARVQIDAGRLGPNMMLLEKADEFIMASTHYSEAALGQLVPKDRSGRAIEKLQNSSAQSSSIYLDNFAKLSLPLEARIILDAMPATYERPGRIAEILEGPEANKTRRVMLNVPHVQGPEGPQVANAADQGAQTFTLTPDAIYGVTTDVKPSYKSRIEEGKEEINELMQSIKDPGMISVLLPISMRFRDEPWAEEAAKKLQLVSEQQFPFLKEQNPGDPQQMMQQLQAMQQENQALKEGIAKLTQEVNTDKAKQTADIQTAQMDGAVKTQIAQLGAKVDLQIAQLQAQTDIMIAKLKAQMDAAKESANMAHDESMAERTMAHDAAEASKTRLQSDISGRMDRMTSAHQEAESRQHEATESAKERRQEGASQLAKQDHEAKQGADQRKHDEKITKISKPPAGAE